MNIIVTGSAGFIGFHLVEKLIQEGDMILGIDDLNDYYDASLKKDRLSILKENKNFKFAKLDITNKKLLNDEFEKFKPDIVINLAAQPGVRHAYKDPYIYSHTNLDGFLSVIEISKNHKVKNFIYASSSSVYGLNHVPFSELDNINRPASLYGATKIANELIAHSYNNMYEMNVTGLRFFTVYGPWYRPDMALFIFAKKIMNGEPITVYNNGKLKRDFTYIDDIVSGIISAKNKNYNCEIFNLGNNKSENILRIISLIEQLTGKKAQINFAPLNKADVVSTFANIDYSTEKLNYKPKTSIEVGIPIFIKWYRKYYNV
tara:strand:+ start:1147 stop:2097 length:951 start_codon:yes stop_codon:yes gene_type:complete